MRGGRAKKRRVRATARPAHQRRVSLLSRPGAGDPQPTGSMLPLPLILRATIKQTGDLRPVTGVHT